MKCRTTMGCLTTLVVLAMTTIGGLGSRAAGQPEKPDLSARDDNSARSSPPDTTPYVRSVIPEDLMKTPVRRGDSSRPASNADHPNSQDLSRQHGTLPPRK
jgi:hypothetical protein